jgi:Carboxypeptidase regulatory-like domain
MSTLARVSLSAALVVFCVVATATTADPLAQGSGAGTATISGTVISDEPTGVPLGGAIVTASGAGLARSRSTVTDAAGTFVMANLPGGRFTVSASKPPYVSMAYGARQFGHEGTPVTLAPADRIDRLVISLPRGAVITGTVRDEQGAPVAGVSVLALLVRAGFGLSTVGPADPSSKAGTVVTDDRGMYRLFGLPSGQYLVGATYDRIDIGNVAMNDSLDVDRRLAAAEQHRQAALPTPQAPAPRPDERYGFAPSWYPGGAGTEPEALEIGTGEERQVDFVVAPVRAVNVGGVVKTEDGVPPASVEIGLLNETAGLPPGFASRPVASVRPSRDNDRFLFTGVTPGKYVLAARGQGASQSGSSSVMMSIAQITVTGTDLLGVSVTLRSGCRVTGRIAYDPAPPVEPLAVRVSLVPAGRPLNRLPSMRGEGPAAALVRRDGTFEIAGVFPGSYTLSVTVAAPWSAKTSSIKSIDALDQPVALGDEDLSGALLTLANRATQLSGELKSQQGLPLRDYVIVVLPTDSRLWQAGPRRVQLARPGTDGRYLFAGLPAGDYLLAALTDVEPGDLADAAFLAALAPGSVRVSLADGESKLQDLQVAR